MSNNKNNNYLVTGVAGFIGFHVAKFLLERGDTVFGIDNLNNYYDVCLKKDRLNILKQYAAFSFNKIDICNYKKLEKLFQKHDFYKVCHLAAQAGVRYSLINPFAYELSNGVGFLNIIELSKKYSIKQLVYASSSSVYGGNSKIPFSVKDDVNKPISLYAATKRSNELVAHTYHSLYNLSSVGLRFFTVYGPWGRPDMALFKFAKAILENKSIDVYNYGKMKRDFTYIDDIVSGVVSSLDKSFSYEIFNLGNSNTVDLLYFIECIERELGKKGKKNLMEIQPGDVCETFADIEYSREKLGFDPKVKIEVGIKYFIDWYKKYYGR